MEYFKYLKGELKKGLNIVKDNIMKTELERKLKEATSNEHCHANVSLLNSISQRTNDREDFYVIYNYCMEKLTCPPEKWLRILKTLFLIEHILRTGNLRFAERLKDNSYKIKNLFEFSYIDGKVDKGETIREKSRFILSLINDNNKLKEERKKYDKWKSRIEGVGSGGAISSSDYSSNYGSVGGSNFGSTSSNNYSSKTKKDEVSDSDSDDDDSTGVQSINQE